MRTKSLWRLAGVLAASMCALPGAAQAVSWTYSGTFNNAAGDVPLGLGVGSAYTLTINIDDNPAIINQGTGVTGAFRVYDQSSIRVTLDVGQDCDDVTPGYQKCSSDGVGTVGPARTLRVFDDFSDPNSQFTSPTDAIQFRFYDSTDYDSTHWQRWTFNVYTDNLSALTGLGLPASLPAGAFVNWGYCTARKFDDQNTPGDQTGNCDTSIPNYFRLDDTNGVVPTVPEPGTLALLGLGVVGLGVGRKRKA